MTSLSRRDALRHLGVGAGLLPLLDATAEAAPFPRRLVVVVWTNGTIPAQFWPLGTGESLAGLKLPAITAPLAPYKDDLVFVSGLESRNFTDTVKTGGHQNYSVTFTAARGMPRPGPPEPTVLALSPSFDQLIADGIARQAALPVRSLHLSVLCGGSSFANCCVYRAGGSPVTPERDPAAAAKKLIAGTNMTSPDLERLRAERRSMLDFVGRQLTRFRTYLGTQDRRKVDAHLESVRELETQIVRLRGATCQGASVPAIQQAIPNYPTILGAHMDVLVSAMKCDLTRVATLQLGNYNGDGVTFPWIGLDGKAVGTDFGPTKLRDWHDCAHTPRDPANPDPTNKDHKIRLDTWIVEQFVALIKRFKSVPEGGGTMLDNTAILFANHMNDGAKHDWNNLPWVIAGRLGGALKTGRFIRAPLRTPTGHLFGSLARGLGVDADSFGDPEYRGALAGLAG